MIKFLKRIKKRGKTLQKVYKLIKKKWRKKIKKILQEMYPEEKGIVNAFEQLEELVNSSIKESKETLDEIIEQSWLYVTNRETNRQKFLQH